MTGKQAYITNIKEGSIQVQILVDLESLTEQIKYYIHTFFFYFMKLLKKFYGAHLEIHILSYFLVI